MKAPKMKFDARAAKAADVVAVYQIVLGRNPENDTVVRTYGGVDLQAVVAEILQSGEMTQLIANVVASGTLPQTVHLDASGFVNACGWLSEELNDASLEAATSWWVLIDRFLNELWCARTGRDVAAPLSDYATFAAARADEDRAALSRIQSGMSFDPQWFWRAHARSMDTSAMAKEAFAAHYFLTIGRRRGDQLLAAFTESLPSIYSRVRRDQRSSLNAHVEAVVEAAGRGETGHWLFAADFCREVRAKRAPASGQMSGNPVSYLQFLLDGDRQGWAPHPLFSHFAYRRLNALSDGHAAFEDYITRGMFEGCRTSSLFDPENYLGSHPAARMAILQGTHHDALHHFLTVGIHRDFSFSPDFDLAYYCEIYPDVVESVRTGAVPSASWHFLHRGLIEGRRPNRFFDPHYYRLRHPHIVAEMAMLGIDSELEHFLLVGRSRGLRAEPALSERRPSLDEAKIVFHRRAMRSFDRQTRIPYDFLPFRLPRPAVSVIVPVCNEAPFTALFLESAFFAAAQAFHGGAGGVEVIIVDNGSTDQTARLVRRTKGLKYLHFPEPIGYPRAIRAGMDQVAGKIVIVANNDLAFAPDTFELAVAVLEADESIGVLGPLVMLPDETLQDAGSFVDRNGGIVNLGRFDNPWDAYFRAAIEVDYCAGCFFAFRSEDYEAVGGIDDAYSPGYYEEVDFAFRMRERLGKRAVVLPDLQVTHFEHASFGKGRPPSTAFATILRNQSVFSGRHRHALLDRPTPSDLAPGGLASTIAIGRRRMLVIADAIPHSGGESRGERSTQLLRELARAGCAFDLLVLASDPDVDDYEDARVVVRRGWMPGEAPEAIIAEAGRRYSHVLLMGLAQLNRFAPQLESIRQATGLQILCDIAALETPRLFATDAPEMDVGEAIRLELRTSTLVSLWITADEHERRLLEESGVGTTLAITTPVATATLPEPNLCDRTGVMLIGGASAALADGAWFGDCVAPLRSSEDRSSLVRIAGGWRTRLALASCDEPLSVAVEIVDTPNLAALEALHNRSRVAVAPPSSISIAGVLQAMAFGVPVVLSRSLAVDLWGGETTSAGLAVAVDDGRDASFAGWIDRLASDPDLWNAVVATQRALLAKRPTAEELATDIDRLIELL